MLPARSHGWHHITEFWHMSCCAGPTSTYVFDGRRYQWRDKRYDAYGITAFAGRLADHYWVLCIEDYRGNTGLETRA